MAAAVRVAVLGRVQDPYRRSLNHWLGGQPGLTLWPCVGRDGLMPRIVAASPQITGAVNLTLTAETVFLFGSDCLPAARAAAQNRCQPLEYGFSRRDTLTLSSLDDRQAVVALQRPLRRLDGSWLEPQEWVLQLTAPARPELLLSQAAILLTAGLPLPQHGEKFLL